MALEYILNQVCDKMGLNPNISTQRAVALRFVNEAAAELYGISDMAGCLDEKIFQVNANQTIALPDYVGQLRAMRQSYGHLAIGLSQMRPRYNEFNWEQEWRNWRLKGLYTLQTSLHNQSILTVTVPVVENPPITINITGPNDNSARLSETLVMSSTSVSTVNAYNDVSSFTKTAVSQYDAKLLDADGNQISYLSNNKLKAQFQIVDISTAPWLPSAQATTVLSNGNTSTSATTANLVNWVEVLFKKALPWLQNDTDEFPAIGYDNVIVNKCLQLWYEEQNNTQSAVAYYQKAMQTLAQIHEDANRGTADTVALVAHPHDKMNHRVGFGRDWWYGYRITGR